MEDKKRLVDVNGAFSITAADNTEHVLCFRDGFISVQDKDGHVLCEFHADDMPILTGQWDGAGNCSNCGTNIYKEMDADVWAEYAPPRCPNCGAAMTRI